MAGGIIADAGAASLPGETLEITVESEEPGGTEIIGMLLIGASLALLSWLTLRGQKSVAPEIGQE